MSKTKISSRFISLYKLKHIEDYIQEQQKKKTSKWKTRRDVYIDLFYVIENKELKQLKCMLGEANKK